MLTGKLFHSVAAAFVKVLLRAVTANMRQYDEKKQDISSANLILFSTLTGQKQQ